MANGETTYYTMCPVCEGLGKFDILTVQSKNSYRKNAAEGHTAKCEICDGKGLILVVKKLRR